MTLATAPACCQHRAAALVLLALHQHLSLGFGWRGPATGPQPLLPCTALLRSPVGRTCHPLGCSWCCHSPLSRDKEVEGKWMTWPREHGEGSTTARVGILVPPAPSSPPPCVPARCPVRDTDGISCSAS